MPASVRGAILGLSAYSPTNKGALCISFGSESGIGEALSHVFDRVSVKKIAHIQCLALINMGKNYRTR